MSQSKYAGKERTRISREASLVRQGRELTVSAQEIEVEKQKDDHLFELGKAALVAQAEDRKHERDFKVKEITHHHRLVLWLTAILSALVLLTIYLGQPTVALEIAKGVGLLLAGGFGGYGLGQGSASSSLDDSQ
jgi:hypothetical protein